MERKNIITFQELMMGRNADFDRAVKQGKRVKIIRLTSDKVGKDRHEDLAVLYLCDERHEEFRKYISSWRKETHYDNILKLEYVVVCFAENNTGNTARFAAVYHVDGPVDVKAHSLQLSEVEGFEALNGRIIINYEKNGATQNIFQCFENIQRDVVAIDNGPTMPVQPFISYNDILLSFDELKNIISNNDPLWRSKLQAVNAVYAIHDRKTNKLYIGSTYGKECLWQRWSGYVATNGTGGNAKLKAIPFEEIRRHFRWMVLETLPMTITKNEAVAREEMYKNKFNTLKLGYNLN